MFFAKQFAAGVPNAFYRYTYCIDIYKNVSALTCQLCLACLCHVFGLLSQLVSQLVWDAVPPRWACLRSWSGMCRPQTEYSWGSQCNLDVSALVLVGVYEALGPLSPSNAAFDSLHLCPSFGACAPFISLCLPFSAFIYVLCWCILFGVCASVT